MFPDGLKGISQLPSTLAILSAMITPAVLIMACGSLILTTSNRLTRVVDRVRELSSEVESLAAETAESDFVTEKRNLLFKLLDKATTRARLLQRAMTRLYVALSTFVATSVAIGVLATTHWDFGAVALALGLVGAVLMLWASVLLIIESRIGLDSTYAEMDFLWKRGQFHASTPARKPVASPPE